MGSVTSLFVRKMVAAAGPQVDAGAILRSVGLSAEDGTDPKAMVADTAYYTMLERIAEQMDVTTLPLRTGASMRCDEYGALGLAFKTAPDLAGSFGRVTRYARLWTSVVEYELQPGSDTSWYVLHRAGPRRLGLRLSNETTLAASVALAREVAQSGHFVPEEVHLRHPAPKQTDRHAAFFGCPVVFDSDRDGILIANTALKAPNRLGDSGLARFLDHHLEAELADLGAEPALADQARDAIARALSDGVPKPDQIARRLGLSARSLRRKLAAQEVSFQTLVSDTRRDLAEGLLADPRYGLAEIAFLTGFAEQSSFNRAFKRWTGQTPATFRAQNAQG